MAVGDLLQRMPHLGDPPDRVAPRPYQWVDRSGLQESGVRSPIASRDPRLRVIWVGGSPAEAGSAGVALGGGGAGSEARGGEACPAGFRAVGEGGGVGGVGSAASGEKRRAVGGLGEEVPAAAEEEEGGEERRQVNGAGALRRKKVRLRTFHPKDPPQKQSR